MSENAPMTVGDHRGQITTIQQVLKQVMQEGVHYGTIPGCGPKPALLKPGAEKILATFHIGTEVAVEELPADDFHIRYRVTARGVHLPTGQSVGQGVGECSTAEEKYAWRAAVSDAEWEDTAPDLRRLKYLRNGNKIKQIRTNPADQANTVLKMAKKRAVVDLCLSATACSDIFTQDIVDEDQVQRPNYSPGRKTAPPPAKESGDLPNPVVGKLQAAEKRESQKSGKVFYEITMANTKFLTWSETHFDRAVDAHTHGEDIEILWKKDNWGYKIEELGVPKDANA